ncbi:PHP domain-containing protein, partial [Flavobacteriaceae bacterium]|nr:PHP domain-containing protein [Flavobacteriaceae bacterium]
MAKLPIFGCTFFLIAATTLSAQPPFFKAKSGSHWVSTDLHIHTVFSDGAVWPSIRVEEARKEGLDLIAMTEHLEYQPHAEDIPHPDRNRSYTIASGMIQPEERLQVINGSEITREMAPGHINAVFIKDANALLYADSLSGIQAANKQGAFVFWNHPNWDAHRKDGIARLDPFHEYLIENKLLHGLEVVNETTYSDEAFQIALENNLTILGTSDIHGLTDWAHSISEGGHRPMTFVSVESKTPMALKKALFEGKTVVWYDALLIGKKGNLERLIRDNISFGPIVYPEDKTIAQLEVTNHSSAGIHMKYLGEYSFHKRATV